MLIFHGYALERRRETTVNHTWGLIYQGRKTFLDFVRDFYEWHGSFKSNPFCAIYRHHLELEHPTEWTMILLTEGHDDE
jgi:hypothetical protein